MSDPRLLRVTYQHPPGAPALRVDLALVEVLGSDPRFDGFGGRKKIKELLELGQIRLEEGRKVKPSHTLGEGTHHFELSLEVLKAQASRHTKLPLEWAKEYSGPEIEILYQSAEWVVLNKPSGIPSIPHQWEDTSSCVHFFLKQFPESLNIGRGGLESGILHRLDTGTSGCLVFARTSAAFDQLLQTWKNAPDDPIRPGVRKTYRAVGGIGGLTPSNPPTETEPAGLGKRKSTIEVLRNLESLRLPYEIRTKIGHDLKSGKKMRAIQLEERDLSRIRGKALPTLSRLLQVQVVRHESDHLLIDLTLEIETGVMHQIRVHCAQVLHLPLLGDLTYGGPQAERLHLHAWKITLPDSSSQGRITIEAPLPKQWPSAPSGV